MRGNQSKRLTVLTESEKIALYGIPDFNDFQRIEYFAMTDAEHALTFARKGLAAQLHCLLQLGYFKAKNAFFSFSLNDAPTEDVTFLMQRYFPGQILPTQQVSDNDRYLPRKEIAALFGFRLWSDENLSVLRNKAILLARTDVSPTFLLAELMVFLIGQRIVRPGYTLRYLRDPQLQRDVHRSENRIESYHQLRSTIAQVNGKKELTGRTDLDVAVSNHCGRLIANVVIAYNSMLLSGLLSRYLATGNEKALDLLRRISPAAWQHLHFLGHYAFRDKRKLIDLEAILAGIDWE